MGLGLQKKTLTAEQQKQLGRYLSGIPIINSWQATDITGTNLGRLIFIVR